jgi:Na+-transporting NADH:ubiquinone oxidoreductase subunit A
MIKIKKGLDLPISGSPEQVIQDGARVRSVALIGFDYPGMKPTMAVKVGDKVKKGQLLFTDKKTEGVRYTAPAAGSVSAIHRGAKRVFQSIVIDVDGTEEETFAGYSAKELSSLSRDKVVENLVDSGLWTSLRTRPFSKVPAIDAAPSSIFVNAMDTNPLAANPQLVLKGAETEFEAGLNALSKLTEGKVFVCQAPGVSIPMGDATNLLSEEFAGPHPAGLSGTHIHFLDPVSESKSVWTINYQDVIAVGKLFLTGTLSSERVISLAGPAVNKPRLLRTLVGANLNELTAGELNSAKNRVISGSVLSGRTAEGSVQYLGRYHLQVVALEEGFERHMLHYLVAGRERHSVLNIFISKLNKAKTFNFTTSTNGSERAMVPVGSYEKVMPLDILPTQLLRALIVGDVDTAIKLGVLELDEEDLALCTYACPGKYEYGPILRDNLTQIEKEG